MKAGGGSGGDRETQMGSPVRSGMIHQAAQQSADARVARADGVDDIHTRTGLLQTLPANVQFCAFGTACKQY